MIAGSIILLDEPVDSPLADYNNGGDLPALHVSTSQRDLEGDSIAQAGVAGGRVNTPSLEVGVDIGTGKVWTDRYDTPEDVTSDWVADVTGAGIIAVESLHGTGQHPFPLDILRHELQTELHRVEFDLSEIATQWDHSGILEDQWMLGADHGDGVSIDYHEDAKHGDPREANVGLGFVLSWRGTVAKGVLYESGYIAVWEDWTASTFTEFVDEQLMPYAEIVEDDDTSQVSLSDIEEAGA